MSSFTKIRIALTFFIAFIIAILLWNYLSEFNTDDQIVVAATDIKERELIKPEMLVERKVSRAARKILTPRSSTSIREFNNYISKTAIPAGTPIDLQLHVVKTDGSKETQKDANGNEIKSDDFISQSYFIGQEQRLLSIRIPADSAFANKLKKGDYVDVYGSFEKKSTNSTDNQTVCLQQGVEVHDVQVIANEDEVGSSEQTISIKVSPEKAGQIVWVKNYGKIDLVLSSAKAKKITINPIGVADVSSGALAN